MNSNASLDHTLRDLDPAASITMNAERSIRAEARLEQITSTLITPPAARRRNASARRRARLGFAVSGAVAAASVGAMAISTALATAPAYAETWAATPTALTAAETSTLAQLCLDQADMPDADVRTAERRGDWVALVATREDVSVMCLAELPIGADHPRHVDTSVTGGIGAVPEAEEFTDGGMATFTKSGLFGLGGEDTASFISGRAGAGVTAVRITDADGNAVDATVTDGQYVAWWPGDAFAGGTTEGNGGPAPSLTYDVTLRDGTVLEDVQPVKPS